MLYIRRFYEYSPFFPHRTFVFFWSNWKLGGGFGWALLGSLLLSVRGRAGGEKICGNGWNLGKAGLYT